MRMNGKKPQNERKEVMRMYSYNFLNNYNTV